MAAVHTSCRLAATAWWGGVGWEGRQCSTLAGVHHDHHIILYNARWHHVWAGMLHSVAPWYQKPSCRHTGVEHHWAQQGKGALTRRDSSSSLRATEGMVTPVLAGG